MASSAKKPSRASAQREAPAPASEAGTAAEPSVGTVSAEPVAEIVETVAEPAPAAEPVSATEPVLEAAPVPVAPAVETVAEIPAAPLAEALPEAPAVLAAVVQAVEAPAAPAPSVAAEAQDSVRALLEKGVVETRARFALAQTTAQEAAAAVEASYGAAHTGVSLLNVKAIEAMQAGADAHFDLMKSLAGAGSVSEVVTLQTEFARKQFETAAARAKEFAELARKVADETAAPLKAHAAKTFKFAV